jgi:hypothetical protein
MILSPIIYGNKSRKQTRTVNVAYASLAAIYNLGPTRKARKNIHAMLLFLHRKHTTSSL